MDDWDIHQAPVFLSKLQKITFSITIPLVDFNEVGLVYHCIDEDKKCREEKAEWIVVTKIQTGLITLCPFPSHPA